MWKRRDAFRGVMRRASATAIVMNQRAEDDRRDEVHRPERPQRNGVIVTATSTTE